jgi:hypothetical protein
MSWIRNTAETEHADLRSLGRKIEISGGREVEVDRLQVAHNGLVRTRGHVGYGGSQPVKKLLLELLLLRQGVTKRCRLSWLTNSPLEYEPKYGGIAGYQPMSTVVHMSPNNFGDLTPYLTYLLPVNVLVAAPGSIG